MIILSNPSKLEIVLGGVVTTNQLPFYVAYVDSTSTTYSANQLNGVTNDTTLVDLLTSPTVGTTRTVKYISVQNEDTVASQVSIILNDTVNSRILVKFILTTGDKLEYTDTVGFRVITYLGELKSSYSVVGGLALGETSSTAYRGDRGKTAYDHSQITHDKTFIGLPNVEDTALSTWAGTTNITTLGTIATGVWNATVIGTTKGGTGLSSYTTGDLPYASASNVLSNLGIGSTGQVLTVAGGVPTWATPSGGGGAISGLTAATATNTILNTNYQQNWQWNTLSTGHGLNITSSSGFQQANTGVLNIESTGTNDASLNYLANSTVRISNSRVNFQGRSIALELDSYSGGGWAYNTALYINRGGIGIGTYTNESLGEGSIRIKRNYSTGTRIIVIDDDSAGNANGAGISLFSGASNRGGTITGNNTAYASYSQVTGINVNLSHASDQFAIRPQYLQSGGTQPIPFIVKSNGQVGLNATTPAASAQVEIASTTRGFLLPRMTTTQRDAISSTATGLQIYNTTTNKLNFYNGSAWEVVTSS